MAEMIYHFFNGEFALGFDCGHYGDLMPFDQFFIADNTTYKNINYVKVQCENLANQLYELNNNDRVYK